MNESDENDLESPSSSPLTEVRTRCFIPLDSPLTIWSNMFKKVFAGTVLLAASSAAADDLAQGKTVFDGIGACASCHGATGKGDGVAAAALTPKPRNFAEGVFNLDTDGDGKKGTEVDLLNVITNGAAKYGGSPMMVGRADISETDRKAMVKYVLSLKGK